jgi:hypothetical protein
VQVEKGIPSVSIWAYFQVLFVLGLEKDVLKLADDDILGHKLQDAGLLVKKRAPKKTKIVSQYHLSKSACDEIAHAFEMSER